MNRGLGGRSLGDGPIPPTEGETVAMLVVLMERRNRQALLAPSHVAALGRLGVVSVGLVGDERTLAVVLEGWAFDPVRAGDSALAALGVADGAVQALHQLAHVAVSITT